MNKRQLIEDIRRINTTVAEEFLTQFDEEALRQYFDHLDGARKQHVRIGTFVRRQPKLKMVS